MLLLHELPALVKKRKRIGRGGSRGGTSGRGSKGQRARSGGRKRKLSAGFEGGQMPLYRRLPKRGFNNDRFGEAEMHIISLEQLNNAFEEGATVDLAALVQKGLVSKKKSQKGMSNQMIKILGNGTLSKKLIVNADAFSKSAVTAIENLGGEVRLMKGM
jgi:large subunit ribosomal protein L15